MSARNSLNPDEFRSQVWPMFHGDDWSDVEASIGGELEGSVWESGIRDEVRLLPSRTGERPFVMFDGHHRAAAGLRTGQPIPYRTVEP